MKLLTYYEKIFSFNLSQIKSINREYIKPPLLILNSVIKSFKAKQTKYTAITHNIIDVLFYATAHNHYSNSYSNHSPELYNKLLNSIEKPSNIRNSDNITTYKLYTKSELIVDIIKTACNDLFNTIKSQPGKKISLTAAMIKIMLITNDDVNLWEIADTFIEQYSNDIVILNITDKSDIESTRSTKFVSRDDLNDERINVDNMSSISNVQVNWKDAHTELSIQHSNLKLEHNNLADQYNTLVEKYNELLKNRTELYNALRTSKTKTNNDDIASAASSALELISTLSGLRKELF